MRSVVTLRGQSRDPDLELVRLAALRPTDPDSDDLFVIDPERPPVLDHNSWNLPIADVDNDLLTNRNR